MAKNGVYFNGKTLIHPGAYSSLDAEGMSTLSTTSAKIIALFGSAKGGEPNKVLWFNDPTIAEKILKGGDLLEGARAAWSPVPKGGEGAYTIACIRTNNATQSTLDLTDDITVVASVGAPIPDTGNLCKSNLTTKGNYTGDSDKLIQIVIDSENTAGKNEATFSWKISGKDTFEATKVAAATGITTDGVTITFPEDNFTNGERWSINLISAKANTVGGTLTSKDFGAWTKKLQTKLEDGTIEGTKRITNYFWEKDVYETFDNVGAAFYLNYIGTKKYAEVNVEHNSLGKAVNLTTKIGESAESCEEDLVLDLTSSRFKGIREIVDYISSFSDDYECNYFPVVSSDIKAYDLDKVTKKSIKTKTLMCATWADLAVTLNTKSEYVTLKRVINKEYGSPKNFNYTGLAGGTDGVSPASWVEFFDLVSPYDVQYIVPLTGDKSIHAEAKAHVNYLSGTLGRERSLKAGGYDGETIAQVKARALRFNSDRVQLVYPGKLEINNDGDLAVVPPYILAAQLAGRQAFLAKGESATFNYFSINALEKDLKPEEKEELIEAGVATFEFVTGKGYRLAKDCTTYSSDSRSLYTERSVRDLGDSLNKELREGLEDKFLASKGVSVNVESVKNYTIGFLQQKIRDTEIVAYKNVKVTYYNRTMTVEYSAAPVEPTNFILLSGHFYTPDAIEI